MDRQEFSKAVADLLVRYAGPPITISMSTLPSHDRLQKIRGYFDPPLVGVSVLWLVEPQLLSPRWWWRNRIQRFILPLRYHRLRSELKEAEIAVQMELLNAVLEAGSEMIDE